ncbi:hypothetical protein Tco_0461937 [Tanacetum coccineum]
MSNTNNNLQSQTSNALHNAIMEAGGKDRPPMLVLVSEGSSETTTKRYMENYKNVLQDIQDQSNAEAEAVQIILTRIDNDIYSTVDACPNAYEMWKAIERFVTLVKQSQELKTISYYKLYDILKQHQNKVNKIRAEILTRTANLLALVAQQQPVYLPQNHPTQYTNNSSTRSQQAATRTRGKAIVNSLHPFMIKNLLWLLKMMKCQRIRRLINSALISLSFKKIYKPTNNNLRTSSNTSRTNQDNTPRIDRGIGYDNQRVVNVARARDNVATQVLNTEQVDWRDDTDDEPEDQKLEAHYLYMAQIQEVTPDAADNSGPIFDAEPLQKIIEIILFIVDSGCSNYMTRNLRLLSNFVDKFLGPMKFRNDQIAPILGYGDLVQGNITIKRVYYVKGLNHNLFSVGQFCDADLEGAFRNSTCYIRDLKGNDLLTGSRGTDPYFVTLQDTSTPNPICLMAKASSSSAWL